MVNCNLLLGLEIIVLYQMQFAYVWINYVQARKFV